MTQIKAVNRPATSPFLAPTMAALLNRRHLLLTNGAVALGLVATTFAGRSHRRDIAQAAASAATLPGAQLVSDTTGGHVWVGHDAELFGAVNDFRRGL